jgi:hypothetical protein
MWIDQKRACALTWTQSVHHAGVYVPLFWCMFHCDGLFLHAQARSDICCRQAAAGHPSADTEETCRQETWLSLKQAGRACFSEKQQVTAVLTRAATQLPAALVRPIHIVEFTLAEVPMAATLPSRPLCLPAANHLPGCGPCPWQLQSTQRWQVHTLDSS